MHKGFFSFIILIFCLMVFTPNVSKASLSEDVEILEGQIDAILGMISKGQILALRCKSRFPENEEFSKYSKSFSERTAKSWSSATSVKRLLDEELPHLTNQIFDENNVSAYPPIAESFDDVAKIEGKLEEKLFFRICAQIIREDKLPLILNEQMGYFFTSLENLDNKFPGLSDYIKANHFADTNSQQSMQNDNWLSVTKTSIGDEYFYDPNVETFEEGKIARVLNNYSVPNGNAKSVVNKIKFFCAKKEFQILADKYYSKHFASGALLEQFNSPMPLMAVPKESSWYLVLLKVCS